ncbi:efflux RND transporter periplasmic adaptor subunit [Halalkalibacter kiskunsagensis]|uniref:Efflux RND transporter periplasmic adaptor subunit n=1 Tax=Halalkalibacter kiskunsagensis TaxID=1548599 RepID=A0ABV6KFE9_9BACI
MVVKKSIWPIFIIMIMILVGCNSETTDNQVSADEEILPIHPVEISEVTTGELTSELTLTGNVMAGSHMVVLPMLTGEVKAVHIKNGDTVQRGDMLIELDATDMELSIAQATAGLEAAQASLTSAKNMREQSVKQAELQLKQAKDMYDMVANAKAPENTALADVPEELQGVFASLLGGNMPTEQDKNQAKTAVKQAEMGLEQAKATDQIKAAELSVKQAEISKQMAEQQKSHSVVTAPMSGQVTGLSVSVGEMASPQAPLMQLVQMDTPIVEVQVNETMLPNLEEGQTVAVHIRSFNQTYEGNIRHISLIPAEQSRSYPVEIELAKADSSLRVGMLAEVKVDTVSFTEQVLVPVEAVIEENGEQFVYVTSDGESVELRIITTNGETREWFGVDNGLSDGEYVVVKGVHQLYDGALVNIRNDIDPTFNQQADINEDNEITEDEYDESSVKGN